MKTRTKLIVISVAMVCTFADASGFNSTGWTDYLGNPQRTGYSASRGPDMPVVLWEVSMPGAFDTSPFIVGDRVLVLWKNDIYHLSKTTVILLDLLTGQIVQEMVPLIPEEYHVFEVFPVDNRIVGLSFRGVYEINLASEETYLLTEIPEKSWSTPNIYTYQATSEDSTDRPFSYTSDRYPVILKDKIVFPTVPAVCLSKSDFSIEWNLEDTTPCPGLHPYNVVGDEAIVVFLVENGVPQLLAVDPSTGEFKWMSDPLPLALWLALGENAVYCGGRNVWAFSRDGSELWEFIPDDDIVSNIVLGPDAVYAADAAKNLYKIDLNGNLIWKKEWKGSPCFQSHLIGAHGYLYCIENLGESAIEPSGSQVTAYNMEDGTILWSLYFGDLSWIRASPAVADGVLVIGRVRGKITALASDPDLFVKQGDAFLSKGLKDQAISSYKKAAELYEKKGDTSRSQDVQERIHELEDEPESSLPTTPPEPSAPIPFFAVILVVVLMGILIAYYLIKYKPKNS